MLADLPETAYNGCIMIKSVIRRLVILFCIEKGIWDLMTVNALMDSFDLKDLEGNQK